MFTSLIDCILFLALDSTENVLLLFGGKCEELEYYAIELVKLSKA